MTRSPVAWYGGKTRLAGRIRAGFVPHRKYVETHAGGLSVLLAAPPAASEVANDLDPGLIGMYRVLAARPDELLGRLRALPYARGTFDAVPVMLASPDPVERAAGFVVRNRMSYSSSGRSFQVDRMGAGGSGWLPFVRARG